MKALFKGLPLRDGTGTSLEEYGEFMRRVYASVGKASPAQSKACSM